MRALLAAVLAMPAAAVPRFAARTALPCSACHVNPSGAGMRSRYGRDVFARTELVAHASPQAYALDPRIGERIALGADLRFALLHQRRDAPAGTPLQEPSLLREASQDTTFFPMQVDLYTAAELHEHLLFYADIAVSGSFETFAMLRALPLHGFVKAGMFVPVYGTRLADHTAAIRERLGFDPRNKDAGVEMGVEPGPLTLQVALHNGEPSGSAQDTVAGKLVTARAELRVALGPLRLRPGGSALYVTEGDDADLRYGPFLWAGLGRITYLGEVGLRERAGRTLYVFYHELALLVLRGHEVFATLEFLDPDIDVADGEATYRTGGGLEIFPVPFGELSVLYRHYFAHQGRGEDGVDEILGLVHVYF